MEIIYRAKDITEAHIVSGLLNANGIEAHVGGYYLQGGIGQLATFDFANVQVAADDVPEARNIIAEYEGEPGIKTECKATENSRRPPRFVIVLMASLLAIGIGYLLFS